VVGYSLYDGRVPPVLGVARDGSLAMVYGKKVTGQKATRQKATRTKVFKVNFTFCNTAPNATN